MKVTLTESQINKLIKGYKQLNEQGEGFNQQTVTKSIDLGVKYDAGKWKLTPPILTTLNEKIKPLVDFLKSNPSSDVKITIVAGESQVTNYDREKCGPNIYTQECKLEPKQLSLLRAQQIQNKLTEIFTGLKSDGTITKSPSEATIKTVLGSTSYTPGTDKPDDPKYREEQKIELIIDAEASYECLVGMKITISYEGKGGHSCDEAIFDVQLNNQSLGVANLNNGTRDVANKNLTKQRSSSIIKNKVSRYNATIATANTKKVAQIRSEIRLYGPKPTPTSYKNGLLLKDYKINGQTLESLGFPQDNLNDVSKQGKLESFYKLIKSQVLIANGGIKFSEETIVDELIVKKMGTLYKFQPSDIGKPITGVMTMGAEIQDKLWKIVGRESDGKEGGIRRQTFQIDQSTAKSIVDGGKIKDMLVLSITPLVGRSGPYKSFYKKGSHSDVPTVKIINGDGDPLYAGMPNVKISRGSLEPKTLLRTDLCGNPLKS